MTEGSYKTPSFFNVIFIKKRVRLRKVLIMDLAFAFFDKYEILIFDE